MALSRGKGASYVCTMTSSQAAGERPKQRRRLLSTSEVEERTAQSRTDLLAAAQSHGPYAWTNTDIRNALLWFRQPATSAPADNATTGPGGSSFAGAAADKDAFDLLRSLLHNPGIAEARPARPRQPADDDSLGYEYRIRKEPKRSEAPVREVLVGYAAAESNSAAALTSSREYGGGRRRPLDAMRSDLADIAMARSKTHELYNACLAASSGVSNNTTPGYGDKDVAANELESDESLSNLVGLSRDNLCLAVLDESDKYFQRPSTAVATAYASEIYDRLVDLEGGAGNARDGDGATGDIAVPPTSSLTNASKQLLDKLRMLALSNMRVMEVYGLLLLEPIRRIRLLGVEQGQNSSSTAHDSKSCIFLSSLDVDNACSSTLCTELCQNVIKLQAKDEKKGNNSIPSSRAWANLASPLLCAISHAYFPFAHEYIQHLLQRTIDIHLDMPRILADRVIKSITSSSDANKDMGEPGGSMAGMAEDMVRLRILALFGTSDRLSSLVRNELERAVDFEGDGSGELTEEEEKRKDIFLSILGELQFDQ